MEMIYTVLWFTQIQCELALRPIYANIGRNFDMSTASMGPNTIF
jgi:hypothetical protein